MLQLLTSIDIYGRPIGISLNGESTYKTKLGLLCTIAVYALILSYMMLGAIYWSNGQKQEEKQGFQRVDLLADNATEYNFAENELEISYFIEPDSNLTEFWAVAGNDEEFFKVYGLLVTQCDNETQPEFISESDEANFNIYDLDANGHIDRDELGLYLKEKATNITVNYLFSLYSSSDGLLYIQGFKSFVLEWFSDDVYKFSDGECRRNLLENSSKKAKATVIESKNCSAERKEEMIAYWVPKRGEKFRDYINIGAQCFDSSDI